WLDDHVRQFSEQVITTAADPLARVQAMHADERLRGLAGLLGQLEQVYLDGDFAMDGVQFPDLVRHSFRVSSVSVNALGQAPRIGLVSGFLRSVWGCGRGYRSRRRRDTTSGRSPMGSRTLARNTML